MKTYALKTGQGNINQALAKFLGDLLEKGAVDALLVPRAVKSGIAVVQTLVKDTAALGGVLTLAPLAMQNAARLVSSLTITNPGQRIGVVLRSCETRALVELVKLQQAVLDNVLIIGVDCLGTFEPIDYKKLVQDGNFDPDRWLAQAAMGSTAAGDTDIRTACAVCGHITAEHAGVHIGWVGVDPTVELLIQVQNEELTGVISELGLNEMQVPSSREQTIEKICIQRDAEYLKQAAELVGKTSTMEGTADLLASCIRCYNCRQACPICFCQECVFVGPLFKHRPADYLGWAQKKGAIEMPTDTTLFHLTRVNHMGLSCVGCGHCESACPAEIPLTMLFKTAGQKVQDIFGYIPGRNLEEELPLATYQVSELEPR